MSKEQTPQISLQELVKQFLIPKYFVAEPSIEEEVKEFNQFSDIFKAGYAASQATVGQQVGDKIEEYIQSDIVDYYEMDTVRKHLKNFLNLLTSPATVAPPVSGDESDELIDIIHRGIEFSKTLKTDSEPYKLGAGYGYSCGFEAGLQCKSKFVQPPVSGDEIEKSFQWLAEVNANGVDNKEDHKIIICDGDYYWELDQDGDQPISPAKLSEMFLKRNSATPIKETVTDGVDDWISVDTELPNINLEYNVAWDVDGGELVTTTMEFNVKSKSWYDVINGGIDVTEHVKFWKHLPKPPKQ